MRADYPDQLDYEGIQPIARVELATPCLQGRCNNHYAKAAKIDAVTATGARFELTRAEPSRFRIYRLNHSANLPSHDAKRVENPGFDPGASSLQTTHSTD